MMQIAQHCAGRRAIVMALAFFVGLCNGFANDLATAFREGGTLYEQGDYAGAREQYQQALAQEGISANVLFNLGNSEYRLGETGRAILAYERALLLAPNHPEAKANLALVQSQAGAKELPRWVGELAILPLSTSAYTWISSVLFWVAVFSAAALLLWRRTPRILFLVMLIGFVGAGYSAAALWSREEMRQVAIVVVPEAVARLEAADRGGVAETLPAGSEVRVLSEHGAWVYCELPGGGRGWLAKPTISRIAGHEALT